MATGFFGAYTWLLCAVLPGLVSRANLGVWILSTLSLLVLGVASTRFADRAAAMRRVALLVVFPIANMMTLASYRPWSISMTAMAVFAQIVFFIACAAEAESEPLTVATSSEPPGRGAPDAARRERWRTGLVTTLAMGFVSMTFAVAGDLNERPGAGSVANAQIFAAIIGTTALGAVVGQRLRRTKQRVLRSRKRVLALSAAVATLATITLLLVKSGRL